MHGITVGTFKSRTFCLDSLINCTLSLVHPSILQPFRRQASWCSDSSSKPRACSKLGLLTQTDLLCVSSLSNLSQHQFMCLAYQVFTCYLRHSVYLCCNLLHLFVTWITWMRFYIAAGSRKGARFIPHHPTKTYACINIAPKLTIWENKRCGCNKSTHNIRKGR